MYSAGEKPITGADGRSLSRTIRGRDRWSDLRCWYQHAAIGSSQRHSGGDLVLTQNCGIDVGRVAKQLESLQLDINNMQGSQRGILSTDCGQSLTSCDWPKIDQKSYYQRLIVWFCSV